MVCSLRNYILTMESWMGCLMSKFTLGKKKMPGCFNKSPLLVRTHMTKLVWEGVERGNVRVKYLAQEDDTTE